MSLSTKILITIVAIFAVSIGGFVLYKLYENNKQLAAIQQSLIESKQLLDNISRAQSQYASKDDIDAFAKQQNINLAVVQKDLDALDAKIQGIGSLSVITTGQNSTNLPSTSTTPNANPEVIPAGTDPYGYLSNEQKLSLNEKFSNVEVPFGEVGFSAWKDKPWDLTVAPRKYSVSSVLAVNNDGQHILYNKMSINTGGKDYEIKIDDNKFLEQYPTASFSWWNPRLFLQANGGVSLTSPPTAQFTPGIGMGIMSYGKTKQNPALTILTPGIGYSMPNKALEITLTPIAYNIGQLLPLTPNTYVGPVIQMNTKADITVGAGLSVGF